ncbi:MAG TPA: glycosyltransferase family 39 protein [bacterium]|nr:glycosyltransferase family 39 protein [bacterium]
MTVWLVLTIILVAMTLRLYAIAASGVWTDEAFSIWVAEKHTVLDIWHWVKTLDDIPPLYYWVLHFWLRVGTSEAALRLLSALCGVLTVLLAYAIGRVAGDPRLGLIGASLVAISPVDVHYSQEIRMYSLLPLLAAASMLGTSLWLRSAGAAEIAQTRRRTGESAALALYVAGTVAAVWTHYPAVFLPISSNAAVALAWLARRRLWNLYSWIVAQIIMVALCLPLLPLYLHQSVGPNFPPILRTSPMVVLGGLFPDVAPLYGTFLLFFLAAAFEVTLAIAVVALAVRRWRGGHYRPAVLITLWLLPVVGELLISALWRPVVSAKVLIWTTIPFYLLVAGALVDLHARPISRVVCWALLIFVAAAGLNADYWTRPEYEAWRPAARYVATDLRSGDLILFNDSFVELPFDFYFQRYRRGAEEEGVPGSFGDNAVDEHIMGLADVPALEALARKHRRIWLVYSHYWYTDPLHLVPASLARVAQLKTAKTFASREPIEIFFYERPLSARQPGAVITSQDRGSARFFVPISERSSPRCARLCSHRMLP